MGDQAAEEHIRCISDGILVIGLGVVHLLVSIILFNKLIK